MSGKIINRDGNLIKVNFPDKGDGKGNPPKNQGSHNVSNRAGKKAVAGFTALVAIPSVMVGTAPYIFINGNNSGTKSAESKLPTLPAHSTQSAQDLIREQGEKKSWDGSYIGQLKATDKTPGKSR